MQANSEQITRPLLVTRQAFPGQGWADLADSATAGFSLWRERRHPVVFADFGPIGTGMSGVRFARALRCEAGQGLRIFLLSASVYQSHTVWARVNGADDVISRDAWAIAGKLSGLQPRSDSPCRQATHGMAVRVTAALQIHGRLGAAAEILVGEVIDDMTREAEGRQPALPALVHEVASRIRDERRRRSFIRSFGAQESSDVAHA